MPITHQSVSKIPNGNVVATEVLLGTDSETVTLPQMSVDASGTTTVAQLVRPGESAVTVSKTNATSVTLTGSAGNKVLLVSHSADPIPNPV